MVVYLASSERNTVTILHLCGVFLILAQFSTSILPYLKLWPVDTYVDLMMQVMHFTSI